MIADKDISLEEALKQDHEFKAAGAYSGDSIAPHSSNMPQSLYESEALMIKDFNRYFIQVLIGNQPSVIWEHNEKYIIFSYDNFDKQFSYVQILDLFGTNKASIKATKRWLDSPRKRSCLGIKFWPSTTAVDPDDPENKLFNTFEDSPRSLLRIRFCGRLFLGTFMRSPAIKIGGKQIIFSIIGPMQCKRQNRSHRLASPSVEMKKGPANLLSLRNYESFSA